MFARLAGRARRPSSPIVYRAFFKLVLQRIDPEAVHRLASGALRIVTLVPGVAAWLRRTRAVRDPALAVSALGLSFPSPLGVAAGVDKDASWFEGLGLLGFGSVEVGTVTARPQSGNAAPRIFRLPRDRALLNRMGFPNPGAPAVAARLRNRTRRITVGVNVGKSMAIPSDSVDSVGADYRAAVRAVAGVCDYLVINVSSPNTPGLKEMQAVDLLRPLLTEVRRELADAAVEIPLLIKIGPDASNEQIDAIADLALELSLDGIVAVNTTEDRTGLSAASSVAAVQGGGVSGQPLQARALEVLERLYARVGRQLVLVSVGGIASPDDAWGRILAGATLLQAYTGFIYGGPAWPGRINRSLARRVRAAGAESIGEVIGSGVGVEALRPTPRRGARNR
jgi:dihydroorotate dehydrogenase